MVENHPPVRELIPEEVRQHLRAAHAEIHKSLEGLLPPAHVEHRRKAQKEMLLAFRCLLDKAIQSIDEHIKEE